jgi:Ser/Thr protein kinase RdoA (MazF antagonist)
VKAAWERVDAYVSTLPHYSECYGLVHADLHLGNLLVEKSCNLITLVDFDDCVKGWYVMDIALLLMDMLVVYSPKDYQAFTHFFLENFLTGYMAEKSLGSFWANQIPVFMRLAEMAIYSQFYKNYDPATGNGWLGKFMPGRRERIESELPFVDADFVGIATKVRERIKK